MRNLLFAVAASALVSYFGLVGRPATLETKLEFAADYVNRHGTEQLSRELGNARLESKVIGKDTLVLRVLDTPTGYETADPNHWRKLLRREVCDTASFRDVFERGGKIRIEIISNIGVEAAVLQFSQC